MNTDLPCERLRAQRSARVLLITAFLLVSFDGHAQQNDADEVTRLRRDAELATGQQRLADAFRMFAKIYAATHEFGDACNAGRLAYRIGKLPEAHRYLSACDELGDQAIQSTLDVRDRRVLKEARNDLALIRTEVARLTVYVSKPGAEVFVDGTKVGTSPIRGEIGLEPGRHRVKATLGSASVEREYDISKGELRMADLGLQEPPPFAAPEAPALEAKRAAESASSDSAPTKTAPPNAPQPVPSPRTWPAVLIWTAGGVAFIGAGFMAGGYFGTKSGVEEMQRHDATVATKGCGAGTPICDTYYGAQQASETAGAVGEFGFAVSTLAASCLFSAGLIGHWNDPARSAPPTEAPAEETPIKIEAAPMLGGLLIRGQF